MAKEIYRSSCCQTAPTLDGRNFISCQSHASNVASLCLPGVNIAARGHPDRMSVFYRLFLASGLGVLAPTCLAALLEVTAERSVPVGRLTARYPAGRQTTTITGYFRRDRSHVCFEGYLVDDGAPTRHDCDVNY